MTFSPRLFLACGLALGCASASPKPGGAAPPFSLPDLFHNHAVVNLHASEGKVVLVDFWASWCPPCRTTVPELGRIRARNPALVVMALSIDEDRAKAVDFLKARDTSVLFLHDAKRETAKKFDLGGMPSAYLIDKHGVLRNRFDGYGDREIAKMEIEVKKLLKEE